MWNKYFPQIGLPSLAISWECLPLHLHVHWQRPWKTVQGLVAFGQTSSSAHQYRPVDQLQLCMKWTIFRAFLEWQMNSLYGLGRFLYTALYQCAASKPTKRQVFSEIRKHNYTVCTKTECLAYMWCTKKYDRTTHMDLLPSPAGCSPGADVRQRGWYSHLLPFT